MIPRWRRSSQKGSNNNSNNDIPCTPSPKPSKRISSNAIGLTSSNAVSAAAAGGGAYHTRPSSSSSTLPHHYRSSPHHHHYQPNLQSPCQNFLLGGHYYPGKDKKTYRKTLWYRIFWSSPLRKCITVIFGVYVCVVWILAPAWNFIWFYGRYLSGRAITTIPTSSAGNKLMTMKEQEILQGFQNELPSLQEERIAALKLFEKQTIIQKEDEKRLQSWMEIVPLWFFRNDAETYEKLTLHTGKNNQKSNDPWLDKNNNNKNKLLSTDQQPQPEKKKEEQSQSQQRTLHTNLTTLQSYKSSCPSSLHSSEVSTTLVIQSSVDRLWIVSDHTCKRWTEPIVLVVYVTSSNVKEEQKEWIKKEYWKKTCPQLKLILHHESKEQQNKDDNTKKMTDYPVNQLRNIGLDAVSTSHVLILDVDLVPSVNLHLLIHETLQNERTYQFYHVQGMTSHALSTLREWEEHQAYVIPAFERLLDYEDVDTSHNDGEEKNKENKNKKKKRKRGHCKTIQECRDKISNQNKLPSNFTDLVQCVSKKDCIVFQSDNNWEGHYTTHSDVWLKQDWFVQDEDLFIADETNNNEDEENNAGKKKDQKEKTGRRNKKYVHPNRVKQIPCFDSPRYEPYVLLSWCPFTIYKSLPNEKVLNDENTHNNSIHTNIPNKNIHTQSILPVSPYYDERFHGYGKNKIQQISHLRFLGYTFNVLPGGGFVVHHPHPESNVKEIWKDAKHYDLHGDMDKLYPKYLDELVNVYKEDVKRRGMIPPCEQHKKKEGRKEK